jgi:predicted GTPase
VLVDTPGIGDQGREEMVTMVTEYIPNALAFVFVVNMASAGGLQDDRVTILISEDCKKRISNLKLILYYKNFHYYLAYIHWILLQLLRLLKRVRGSLNHMHSFNPEDAIFLLNKWDTLVLKKRKTDLFEETKRKLHNIWEEVDDKYILKFAAARVSGYGGTVLYSIMLLEI